MTHPMTPEQIAEGRRTIASLLRLEKAWCRRHRCGWCDASLLASHCYALSGKYTLGVVEGVRDREETINLGEPCNMDEVRAKALAQYKPRPRHPLGDPA